jgi:hypothetical protein
MNIKNARSLLRSWSRKIRMAAKRTVSGCTSFVIDMRQIIGEKANRKMTGIGAIPLLVKRRPIMYKKMAAIVENNADRTFRFWIGSPGMCAKKYEMSV